MGAKLVRDRIGDIDWPTYPETKAALRPVHDDAEFASLLMAKLGEEIGEFLAQATSGSFDNAAMEAGDVIEVMCGILRRMVSTPTALSRHAAEVVEFARARRYDKAGGFEHGTVFDVEVSG